MVDLKKLSKVLIAGALLTVVLSYKCEAASTQINSTQSVTSSEISTAHKIKRELKASYKLIGTEKKIAVISINGKELIKFDNAAKLSSVEERAKIITNNLNAFIKNKADAKTLRVGLCNGGAVAKYGNKVLFSIDKETAEAQRLTGFALAYKWVNNVRVALGSPALNKEIPDTIASRSLNPVSLARTIFNTDGIMQQAGNASWYGGRFHGRRAADGSVFNTFSMTAAHKTLPFGTMVKVTNLKNGKKCIVKINDRGPFVRGRIIDLSTAAARQIGILSSGVGQVKIETIN